MKQWKLAPLRLACGAVQDCWIDTGAPFLELTGVSGWRLVRCGQHAGQPVPEGLEEPLAPQPSMPQPVAFTALQALTTQFDARRKQANDD